MKPTVDPSVSLLARLCHLAQTQDLPAGSVLLLSIHQSFLAGLDASGYAEQFVVKGGLSLSARYQAARQSQRGIDTTTIVS